jgi:phage major head subunit gpT-like protein
VDEISAREWTTDIRDWQDTIKINRNDVLDDRIGIYTPTVQMQAEQAKKYPDVLLKTTIQDGASSITWDGANFFSTTHPINVDVPSQGTQSNLFTGTALTWANYASVRASMQSLVGLDGQPLYVRPSILLVPPQLEVQAKSIIHDDMVAVPAPIPGSSTYVASQSNTLKNTAEVVVMPELSNQGGTWYLIDATKPMLPFLFADRQAPQFQLLINPNDPNVFWQKQFLFGWDARGATDYGLWFLAAKASA